MCGVKQDFFDSPRRVVAFVDGFNLYHAIADTKLNYLKWLDLRRLIERFAHPPQFLLREVRYFSAYATWRPASYKRHRAFVAALVSTGVIPILGEFKGKTLYCKRCQRPYPSHEEKETDVNIALHLFRGAVQDEYDTAMIVSGDSDLAPAVRMVKADYPTKRILILCPPGRAPSYDLLHAAGGQHNGRRLKRAHLEAALFPKEVRATVDGAIVVVRPTEYDPPHSN